MQKFLRLPVLASLFIASLLFTGCAASTAGQGNAAYVSGLEERLAKNEAAIADLNHRISILQIMVDDHENMLRLGKRSTGKTP